MAPGAKSVEEVYQKISQLDHILLRPDTYIGSVELTDKTVSLVLSLPQSTSVFTASDQFLCSDRSVFF